MALVKWFEGFVKIQQRTRVVLNRISLSNNDGNDDSVVVPADGKTDGGCDGGCGDGCGGIIVVINVVSFCKLNQMSVKRMPIIKPIIKQKIFLQSEEHNEHVSRDGVDVGVAVKDLSGNFKA